MHFLAVVLASTTLAVPRGPAASPVVWSSDGQWIAYTLVTSPDHLMLPAGWLYQPEDPDLKRFDQERLGWSELNAPHPASRYQVWISRPGTDDSLLVEESDKPLSALAWRGDGKALAYGRITSAQPDGKDLSLEVVVQDGLENRRVLYKQTLGNQACVRAFEGLSGQALAWSPDGRYLAVPWLQPSRAPGISIVQVEQGRLLKQVPDAQFPAWSPDSSKLVFVQGDANQSVQLLDTSFGTSRLLAAIGQTRQAPIWSRDGLQVFLVVRQSDRVRSGQGKPVSELARISTMGEAPHFMELPEDPQLEDQVERGVSFAVSHGEDSLLYSMVHPGEQSIVTWFIPRNNAVQKKDNPVDFSLRLSAYSLSPRSPSFAFRAGGPGHFAPLGLWELTTGQFRPITPDDSARLAWVATLLSTTRKVLRDALSDVGGMHQETFERATLLPIPGELTHNNPLLNRLRRHGRTGATLCQAILEKKEGKPELPLERRHSIEEALLFFNTLQGAPATALRGLEEILARTDNPDHRLRLLSVRAQLDLERGRSERAEETIEMLQAIERRTPQLIETTPLGVSLAEKSGTANGPSWTDYLSSRARAWAEASNKKGSPVEPGRNPFGEDGDAMPPQPAQEFDDRMDEPPILEGLPLEQAIQGGVIEQRQIRVIPRILPPARQKKQP